jgi:hypothetical protein
MKNYQLISNLLENKGFELYLSTKSLNHEEPNILQDIFTCTKGMFNGEVVDVYYDITNNEIKQISVSSQFHTQDGGKYETTPKILKFI